MIRIAIVDDILEICSQLERFFQSIAKQRGIEIETEPYPNGERFCSALKKGEVFDLIFLDIELQSMNGVEVAEYIRQTLDDELQQIVFISAQKQYSLELHRFHPLDFLVKEIQEEDVERVLVRFLKLSGMWNETFECKVGHDMTKIKIRDIRYLTITNRVVIVMQSNHRKTEYYGTLETAYKEQLQKQGFLFVHKQFIVNPAFIEIYEYDKVILNDGMVIPIGSSRRKEVRAFQVQQSGRRRKP